MHTSDTTPSPTDPDQFVRAKEAARYLGVGLSSFWKLVADGRIERPIKLAPKTSVWRVSTIRQFQQQLIDSSENK
ncbi:AlpA family transcriptional regulator [Microbulbifer sp. HZ11]|uniref:helix-turn-helix transcriptional regulator n=1 Tax=Microbulbifer sp. HZ11 TaxID=1453501 RepID=UPI0005B91064|nr:hypothetical protein [Microbulbifer sp. HZ11]